MKKILLLSGVFGIVVVIIYFTINNFFLGLSENDSFTHLTTVKEWGFNIPPNIAERAIPLNYSFRNNYDAVGDPSLNGNMIVMSGGLYGLINKDGVEITAIKYKNYDPKYNILKYPGGFVTPNGTVYDYSDFDILKGPQENWLYGGNDNFMLVNNFNNVGKSILLKLSDKSTSLIDSAYEIWDAGGGFIGLKYIKAQDIEIINPNGEVIKHIPGHEGYISNGNFIFSGGLMPMIDGKLWGLMNEKGEWKIEPIYSDVVRLYQSIYGNYEDKNQKPVASNNMIELDEEGNKYSAHGFNDYTYDKIYDNNIDGTFDGIAVVEKGGKDFILNTQNNTIIYSFSGGSGFDEGRVGKSKIIRLNDYFLGIYEQESKYNQQIRKLIGLVKKNGEILNDFTGVYIGNMENHAGIFLYGNIHDKTHLLKIDGENIYSFPIGVSMGFLHTQSLPGVFEILNTFPGNIDESGNTIKTEIFGYIYPDGYSRILEQPITPSP